jgi:hypothetical protein
MDTPEPQHKRERKPGRAAGGAARMASLSTEQRQQLARAAAAARWRGGISKRAAARPQQAVLITRMCNELEALRQERELLDRKIHGLTQAVRIFGVEVPPDPEVANE